MQRCLSLQRHSFTTSKSNNLFMLICTTKPFSLNSFLFFFLKQHYTYLINQNSLFVYQKQTNKQTDKTVKQTNRQTDTRKSSSRQWNKWPGIFHFILYFAQTGNRRAHMAPTIDVSLSSLTYKAARHNQSTRHGAQSKENRDFIVGSSYQVQFHRFLVPKKHDVWFNSTTTRI